MPVSVEGTEEHISIEVCPRCEKDSLRAFDAPEWLILACQECHKDMGFKKGLHITIRVTNPTSTQGLIEL